MSSSHSSLVREGEQKKQQFKKQVCHICKVKLRNRTRHISLSLPILSLKSQHRFELRFFNQIHRSGFVPSREWYFKPDHHSVGRIFWSAGLSYILLQRDFSLKQKCPTCVLSSLGLHLANRSTGCIQQGHTAFIGAGDCTCSKTNKTWDPWLKWSGQR